MKREKSKNPMQKLVESRAFIIGIFKFLVVIQFLIVLIYVVFLFSSDRTIIGIVSLLVEIVLFALLLKFCNSLNILMANLIFVKRETDKLNFQSMMSEDEESIDDESIDEKSICPRCNLSVNGFIFRRRRYCELCGALLDE